MADQLIQFDAFFSLQMNIREQIRLLDRLYEMEKNSKQRQLDTIRYQFNIYKANYEAKRQELVAQLLKGEKTNEKRAQTSENREL